MRGLKPLTRRAFGQGLGMALTLTGLAGSGRAEDAPGDALVRIARFVFEPRALVITAGDSITWRNADTAPHTATAKDGTWDTGMLEKGDQRRLTFHTPGDYTYFCVFHPHMTGRVTVVAKGRGEV